MDAFDRVFFVIACVVAFCFGMGAGCDINEDDFEGRGVKAGWAWYNTNTGEIEWADETKEPNMQNGEDWKVTQAGIKPGWNNDTRRQVNIKKVANGGFIVTYSTVGSRTTSIRESSFGSKEVGQESYVKEEQRVFINMEQVNAFLAEYFEDQPEVE